MRRLAAELRDSTDFSPKLILPSAGFGGVRQDSFDLEMLGQLPDGVLKLIIRHAIAFGSHDDEGPVLGSQPFDELLITVLGRDIGIDEHNGQRPAKDGFRDMVR